MAAAAGAPAPWLAGSGLFAGLPFDELESDLGPRFQPLQQRCVGGLELHGHGRPFEAGDRAVIETNRAGRRVDAIHRAFGLVASAFGGWLSGCCRLPFFGGCSVGGMAETADRRLEVALGIDQEVGGDHHLFAFLDPLQHFDVIVAARPEFDIARLEAAFALLDQHNLAGTAVDDGGSRYRDHLAFGAHR
mgnify:CR=1 FL=1